MSDCPFVAKGENQEEVTQKMMEHHKNVHGMTEMADDMKDKAMSMAKES